MDWPSLDRTTSLLQNLSVRSFWPQPRQACLTACVTFQQFRFTNSERSSANPAKEPDYSWKKLRHCHVQGAVARLDAAKTKLAASLSARSDARTIVCDFDPCFLSISP